MKKFEYLVKEYHLWDWKTSEIQAELNKFGDQSWEVVASSTKKHYSLISNGEHTIIYTLKREKI